MTSDIILKAPYKVAAVKLIKLFGKLKYFLLIFTPKLCMRLYKEFLLTSK